MEPARMGPNTDGEHPGISMKILDFIQASMRYLQLDIADSELQRLLDSPGVEAVPGCIEGSSGGLPEVPEEELYQ